LVSVSQKFYAVQKIIHSTFQIITDLQINNIKFIIFLLTGEYAIF
jgi:hypothetical protein